MRAYFCRLETGIILTCHSPTFWLYNVMWPSLVAFNHESTGLKTYFHNGIFLIKKNRRGKKRATPATPDLSGLTDSSGGMIREEFPWASSLVLLLSSCICTFLPGTYHRTFSNAFQADGYSGRNTCQETFVNEDSHLRRHMALCWWRRTLSLSAVAE